MPKLHEAERVARAFHDALAEQAEHGCGFRDEHQDRSGHVAPYFDIGREGELCLAVLERALVDALWEKPKRKRDTVHDRANDRENAMEREDARRFFVDGRSDVWARMIALEPALVRQYAERAISHFSGAGNGIAYYQAA